MRTVSSALAFLVFLPGSGEETSPEGDAHRWVVVRTARGPEARGFRDFVDLRGAARPAAHDVRRPW